MPCFCNSVSIGRRLQDPLSEYVKIDPESLGVGMYQVKYLAHNHENLITCTLL